jgi:hypothetical protein
MMGVGLFNNFPVRSKAIQTYHLAVESLSHNSEVVLLWPRLKG